MAIKNKNQKGFSLIEILISISILVVVLGGVTSMAVGVIKTSSLNKYELEAYARAQRQLELVKQYRNTNLIDNDSVTSWDTGINDGSFDIDNLGKAKWQNNPDRWLSSQTGKRYTTKVSVSNTYDSELGKDMKKITVTTDWDLQERSRNISISTMLSGWYWEVGN